VFIDISGESEGQKVAMEETNSIGSPLAIFQSFVSSLNRLEGSDHWLIAVNAMSSEESFWEAVKENKGKISEIDFVFAAPNIWKGETETENALRELNKNYGAKLGFGHFLSGDGRRGLSECDVLHDAGIESATVYGGSKSRIVG
jgi:hypothetical protein